MSLSGARSTIIAALVAGLALGGGAAAQQGWSEKFPRHERIAAAGEYKTPGVTLAVESFSPLTLEPSSTAVFVADPIKPERITGRMVARRAGPTAGANELVFNDDKPALVPDPGGANFYKRAEGSISALGWVDRSFRNVRVTGEVNTSGGRGGQGAKSRQGVMLRWDLGNNFYWFNVDFTIGEFSIIRAKYFGVLAPLEGSVGKVRNFDPKKAYTIDFEARGDSFRGRIFEPGTGRRGRLVGDTGRVRDASPHMEGVSGFLGEPALAAPFEPLEASFANLSSVPLRGGAPGPTRRRAVPLQVPEGARAHLQEAKALAGRGEVARAAAEYSAALAASPNFVEALTGLAWLRATSRDPAARDPGAAVQMAEKAVGSLVELFSQGGRGRRAAGAQAFSMADLVRAGNALAAAYASAGRFKSELPPREEARLRLQTLPQGVSAQQAARALAASVGMAAESTADWVVTFAERLSTTQRGAESASLLETSRRVAEAVRAGRPVEGIELP